MNLMFFYTSECVMYVLYYCTSKESYIGANYKCVFLNEFKSYNVNILLSIYCSCLVKCDKELRKHFLF